MLTARLASTVNGFGEPPPIQIPSVSVSVLFVKTKLAGWFSFGAPVRGPWLFRWDLSPDLRDAEEALIAAGDLPAMGARIVAIRHT